MELHPSVVIRRLGGTSATANLCEVQPSSVSEWKSNGFIPKARLQFLRLARPEVFVPVGEHPSDAARTSTPEQAAA